MATNHRIEPIPEAHHYARSYGCKVCKSPPTVYVAITSRAGAGE